MPNPNPGPIDLLLAASCVSPSSCTAVGYYDNSSGHQVTLVERWDGMSWTVVPSPNPSDTQPNRFFGVSCVSADSCAAVGYYGSDPTRTLTESWDGTAWRIVPSPNPGSNEDILFGVSCAFTNSFKAAGYFPGQDWGTCWSCRPG